MIYIYVKEKNNVFVIKESNLDCNEKITTVPTFHSMKAKYPSYLVGNRMNRF
jgi:hypothetical protein